MRTINHKNININFIDDIEKKFFNDFIRCIHPLIDKYGFINIIIGGSFAMFLHGIRLREHQNECNIDLILVENKEFELINKDLELFNKEYFNKYNLQFNIYDDIKHFGYDTMIYKFDNCEYVNIDRKFTMLVQTPESYLHDKLTIINKTDKDINDIEYITNFINKNNDNKCINVIETLNEIKNKFNIQYGIAGSNAFWIQNINLLRNIENDLDLILIEDTKSNYKKIIPEVRDIFLEHGYIFPDIVNSYTINDVNLIKFKNYECYVDKPNNIINAKLNFINKNLDNYDYKYNNFHIKINLNTFKMVKHIHDLNCISLLPEYNYVKEELKRLENYKI